MKIQDIITEEIESPTLYHFVSLGENAIKILRENRIRLNAFFGNAYPEIDKTRYYYLSLTRSKWGSYHSKAFAGVMLNLNADKLRNNFRIMPFDYWNNRKNPAFSEAEDRLVSNKPYIENIREYINEVHVIFEDKSYQQTSWAYTYAKAYFIAKQMGIPAYYYNNQQDWKRQNKAKAIVPDAKKLYGYERQERLMRAKQNWSNTENRYLRVKHDDLKPWVELYYAKDAKQLSDEAQGLLRQLKYGYGTTHMLLQNDIHNNKRRPTSALRSLINVMRKNKIRSAREYVLFLQKKWMPSE